MYIDTDGCSIMYIKNLKRLDTFSPYCTRHSILQKRCSNYIILLWEIFKWHKNSIIINCNYVLLLHVISMAFVVLWFLLCHSVTYVHTTKANTNVSMYILKTLSITVGWCVTIKHWKHCCHFICLTFGKSLLTNIALMTSLLSCYQLHLMLYVHSI